MGLKMPKSSSAAVVALHDENRSSVSNPRHTAAAAEQQPGQPTLLLMTMSFCKVNIGHPSVDSPKISGMLP